MNLITYNIASSNAFDRQSELKLLKCYRFFNYLTLTVDITSNMIIFGMIEEYKTYVFHIAYI